MQPEPNESLGWVLARSGDGGERAAGGHTRKSSGVFIWLACLVLLMPFVLALNSAQQKSATFDEDAYIGKGTAIWMKGNYGLRVAHPPLGPILSTFPLLTEPGLAPPVDHRCWPDGTARSCGRELLFYRSDTRRVLFLARLPSIFLILILAALVHRWTVELFGVRAGLVALVLCAFDPNILAHGRLVTLDLVTTVVIFLTCFLLWRFWRRPTRLRLVLIGIALGMAGATHFATGLLVPVFVVTSLVQTRQAVEASEIAGLRADSQWRRLAVTLALLLVAGAVAALVIWAVHRFSVGPVSRWRDVELPAPAFFNELAFRLQEKAHAPNSFLLGRHYTGGWWPYFIVAWFVKTPWPTILLTALGVTYVIRQDRRRLASLVLLSVPGVYFVLASFSDFNRGYRYILPVLPFLFVIGGRVADVVWSGPNSRRVWPRTALTVLLGWLVIGDLSIHPHYLAYFNELVGPSNGYKVLVDSNLDWGQDLPALEQDIEQRRLDSIYLSWFGESRPSHYDIPHRSIPSKPDELSDIYTRVYHPDYPPPGSYAISATNLQGLLFDDKGLFNYFHAHEPVGQPGYSIMMYEVPRLLDPHAPSVTVGLGSIQIDQVPSSVFEEFWHTNDVRLGWFDNRTSCILAAGLDSWYVLSEQATDRALLCPHWDEAQEIAQMPKLKGEGDLWLYRLQVEQAAHDEWLDGVTRGSTVIISDEIDFAPGEATDLRDELSPPLRFADRLDLVGYRNPKPMGSSTTRYLSIGQEWNLITYWRVVSESEVPMKVFVQLLDDAGNVRAQYDGLDIPAIGWRQDDILVQQHSLSIPEDLKTGRYWVQFGFYNAWTKQRLPVLSDDEAVGSRLLLPPLRVD